MGSLGTVAPETGVSTGSLSRMGIFFREPLTAAAVRPLVYNSSRALIASARRMDKAKETTSGQKYRAWQAAAWEAYDAVGEIHYGFNLLANTFSRLRIYPGAVVDSDEVPVPVSENKELDSRLKERASALVADLVSSDFSSQARTFALNMAVAGECLLMQFPGSDGSDPTWEFKSTEEIRVEADKITQRKDGRSTDLAVRRGGEWTPDLAVGRIWRQHPRFTEEPDSSMKALETPITELLLLSKLIRNVSRASLNAGVLFVPDGITVMGATSAAAEQVVDSEGNVYTEAAVEDANQFVTELIDSMVTPITEDDATSSVVPSVLTGPSELGAAIRHITFDRKTDEWLSSRADRALERIMQGIDIPKEIVTGLAQVKYSNAVVIDQNFWKTAIEPLALTLCDALTDIYLRPILKAEGFTDEQIEKVCVWYDPSEIVTSPDQSGDATEGYDKYVLNAATWRRLHGFAETDAPSEKELAVQMLLAKGNLPEDVVSALLDVALPGIMKSARESGSEGRVPESAGDILDPSAPVDIAEGGQNG